MTKSGRRRRRRDLALAGITGTAAAITAAAVFLIAAFLVVSALPAIRFNGADFFRSLTWNSGNQYGSGTLVRHGVTGLPGASFGILVFVFGTLASSILAMLIATPVAILVAIALVYRVPRRAQLVTNALVELMAGVPSVVYGLWGVIVLVPFIGNVIGPFVTERLGFIPVLGGSAGSGNGLFASGLLLAIMILPIMAATMRDLLDTVERDTIEASIALGATFWQTVTSVAIPAVRVGFIGAALLALGRAFGETMAVLMVSGSALNQLPQNLFAPINTMAASIVSQLDSALTDASGLSVASLAEIALVLFAMTLAVNVVARLIVRANGGSRITQ